MNVEIITSDALNVMTLLFMAVTAIAIARIRNLFAVVMLSGIYSLMGATLYVILDAVDRCFHRSCCWCWCVDRPHDWDLGADVGK